MRYTAIGIAQTSSYFTVHRCFERILNRPDEELGLTSSSCIVYYVIYILTVYLYIIMYLKISSTSSFLSAAACQAEASLIFEFCPFLFFSSNQPFESDAVA